MVMKCPRCGNEVSPDEAFCGQCGTPMAAMGQPSEMTQSSRSASPITHVLGPDGTSLPVQPQAYNRSGMLPAQDAYRTAPMQTAQRGQPLPDQSAIRPSGQQPGFYQDATEAMPPFVPTPAQSYAPGYPQQSYTIHPPQQGYPGSAPLQPFQQGSYAPPFQQVQTPGGFGTPPQITPPPKKESNNTPLIIAVVLLVVALIAVSVLGTVFFFNRHTTPTTQTTPTATVVPSPTSAPSPTSTPSPSPTPSPTVAPTPTPFSGFTWCGGQCLSNGFAIQYPQGWNQGQTSDHTGVVFLNPAAQDEYAAVKTPGATSSTADTLVTNDLQANFVSQPGYTPPTSTLSTTIGGVTWVYQTATYQYQSQQEQINVYATVYQGKGYIIELQAAVSQFQTVNGNYFATTIGSFAFAQSTG